jgi:hypothetical protein
MASDRDKDRDKNEDERELEDDDGFLGNLPESVRERLEAFVPELVKKTFAAGMGAVFSTEEGIRKMTREMKLPKEVAGYLMDTASGTKDEFLRILAREVSEFLQTINLSEEIAKMLTMLSFEVKTEIRFIPNDEKWTGVEPDVKAKVRVKKSDIHDDDDDDGEKPKRRLRRRNS